MRKSLRILTALAGALIIMSLVTLSGCGKKEAPVPIGPAKIDFATSYDQALKLAQEKNQKILIDFYTDWCTWCKKLDTETYVDTMVVSMSGNIVFTKINAEVDTATARKYSVKAYPTIVLLNSDGTEIDRIAGFLPGPDFVETVNNYLNDIQTLNYYLRMAAAGETTELNFRIGEKYQYRGMVAEAENYYGKVIAADPDNKEGRSDSAMMALAEMKMQAKMYEEAIARFAEVMKKFAGQSIASDAEIMTAIVYREKGDTAMAIKSFEGFIKNNPASPDTAYAQKQILKLKNPAPVEGGK